MAPWVPTKSRDISRFLDLLKLGKWDRFLEIGCGDGRVSYSVAKKFPGAHIHGIEIAFPVYLIAYARKIFSGQKNYHVSLGNAFKQDLGTYNVIYVFWMPEKMSEKIVPKFLAEAKSWAKLYSYVFSIPDEYKQSVISYGLEWEAKIHVLEKK